MKVSCTCILHHKGGEKKKGVLEGNWIPSLTEFWHHLSKISTTSSLKEGMLLFLLTQATSGAQTSPWTTPTSKATSLIRSKAPQGHHLGVLYDEKGERNEKIRLDLLGSFKTC